MKKLKLLLYTFACVTTCVDIATAVYTSVFYPGQSLGAEILWQILTVSFLCCLPVFQYPEKAVSRGTVFILFFVHYVEVNLVVLGCGLWFEWFSADNLSMVLGMLILIALTFVLVSFIVWMKGKREAQLMNECLKEYQERRHRN